MIYYYYDIIDVPDLDGLKAGIAASLMSNKDLNFLRWDSEPDILTVAWNSTLNTEDKLILDSLVITYS